MQLVMKLLYVPLPPEALAEIARQAARELRSPRQQAAFLLTKALLQGSERVGEDACRRKPRRPQDAES